MIHSPEQFLLIAGPCSLESLDIARAAAEVIAKVKEDHPEICVVFKGSFDKANRTSLTGERGSGLEEGLKIFSTIKEEFHLPVITDIHLPDQAATLATVCDALQIPAFLCRQTDLLLAAAQTGKAINIKKGQFLSPFDMSHAVKKLISGGAKEIWQCERGTTFGYNNLVVDMRSFPIMKKNGVPTVFDASHSVQLPGAANGSSGGQLEYIRHLTLAALGAGADGLFVETHPNPSKAISDPQSQLPLHEFSQFVKDAYNLWKFVKNLSKMN